MSRIVAWSGLMAVAVAGCGSRGGGSASSAPSPSPPQSVGVEAAGTRGAPTVTSEPTSAAAVSVEILREWRGRIALPLTGGRMRPAHEPPRVIRDPRGYDDFLALIPAKRVQMKQPAPASEDPLLKRPPVDFERELLIVAFRVDSMYVHPEITNLKLANDTLMGQVDYPPLGASRMAAARVDVGTYHAVVVRRRAGRVQISDVRAESR